jgi:hypothetical protein
MYPPGYASTQARNPTGGPTLLDHIGRHVQTGMAMPALQDNIHISGQFTEPYRYFLNKQGHRAWDMSSVVFPRLPQVHNE